MFKEITPEEFADAYNIMHIAKDWAAISADNGEERNSMIIGWAGLGVLWSIPTFTSYIHLSRHSKQVFDKAKYYSVSIMVGENRKEHKAAWGYLGSASGRDEDKFAGAEERGLTVAEEVIEGERIPYFAESDFVVLCEITGIADFDPSRMDAPERITKWYASDGVHSIYEGQIVKVLAKS